MGTRSRIGYVDPETTQVVSVYCHWDGYPSHHGTILLENYNTLEAVKALVAPGDMSSLAEKCDKPKGKVHSFESPAPGYTVYYGRDRGEENVGRRTDENETEYFSDGEEFNYLFKDGIWYFSDHGRDAVPLTENDCKE